MYLGEPGRTSIGSYYEISRERAQVRGRRGEDGLDRPRERPRVPLPERRARAAYGDAPCANGGRRHDATLLWQPSAERIARANITEFARARRRRHGAPLPDYASLWRWSTDEREAFWRALWDFAGVIGERGERTLVDADADARRALVSRTRASISPRTCSRAARADDAGDALVFRGEDKVARRVSHAELRRDRVAHRGGARRRMGVAAGDRVAAYLPNMPEAIVAMLGATSLGAIWSSCSPDFGVQGVLDRFGQIEPRVLFTVDGYWYNGKPLPILDKVADDRRASCRPSSASSSFRISRRRAGPQRSVARSAAPSRWDAFLAPHAAGADRVRAAAVRPSALHPVFVRHDRRAEVHRPRRRRHAAAAPEGAPAARRPQAGRPAVLLHDLRLDDVELARVRPRRRRDAAALRRLAVRRPRHACCGTSPKRSG